MAKRIIPVMKSNQRTSIVNTGRIIGYGTKFECNPSIVKSQKTTTFVRKNSVVITKIL